LYRHRDLSALRSVGIEKGHAMPVPVVEAPFADAIVRIGRERPEVVVLSADLSRYTDVFPFAEEFPDRFFQIGMAEQNMMGVAGGFAKTGFIPVAVTYGVFAARRACEQVQMALATGRNTAVVVAFLPGISTPFRATHQATDDLAIMRGIPGMTVVDPADAGELAGAIAALVAHPGPAYLRGLRGAVPRLLPDGHEFVIGRTYLVRDGGDVGLIGTGMGTQWALEAAEALAGAGVHASVLHVPTLKPFDGEAVARFCARFPAVSTVENHSTVGGLGSAVAEALAVRGVGCRLNPLGVPDIWAPAGPQDYIREQLGLDAKAIASAATAQEH
jgi:transketolase